MKLLKHAVELGNVEAMNILAVAYEHGRGVKHADMKKAKQLYRMGADRGYARAQCNLANVLWKELQSGIRSSAMLDSTLMSEIHRLYDLSATQGHHDAIYMKGTCYRIGIGVEKDYVEARRWLERAAATTGRCQQLAIDQLAKLRGN